MQRTTYSSHAFSTLDLKEGEALAITWLIDLREPMDDQGHVRGTTMGARFASVEVESRHHGMFGYVAFSMGAPILLWQNSGKAHA